MINIDIKTFKQFTQNNNLFFEVAFKKRKDVTFIARFPMFTVFAKTEDFTQEEIDTLKQTKIGYLKKLCLNSQKEITKLGFKSEHANILIKDLSKFPNPNTGQTGAAGYASRTGGYIAINKDLIFVSSQGFTGIQNSYQDSDEVLKDGRRVRDITDDDYMYEFYGPVGVKVITHEWAHLKMFRSGKAFKKAIIDFYKNIKDKALSGIEELPPKNNFSDENYDAAVKQWIAGFTDIRLDFTYIQYILQRSPSFLDNNLEFLPHGFTFYWNKDGENYNAFKGHGDVFLVRKEGDSIYNESKLTAEKMFSIYGKDVILSAAKKRMSYWKKESPQNVKKYMVKELSYRVPKELKEALKPEIVKWVDDFIFPAILKMLRRQDKTPLLNIEDSTFYDEVWSSNPKKPKGLSIGKMAQDLTHKKNFKDLKDKAVNRQYLSGEKYNDIRTKAAELVNWAGGEYGLSNDDELWATAIENFFDLPYNHKKEIIKLMGIGA